MRQKKGAMGLVEAALAAALPVPPPTAHSLQQAEPCPHQTDGRRRSRRQRRVNTRYGEQDPPGGAVAARPRHAAMDGHLVSLTPGAGGQGAPAPSHAAHQQPSHELAVEGLVQRFLRKHPDAPTDHIQGFARDVVGECATAPEILDRWARELEAGSFRAVAKKPGSGSRHRHTVHDEYNRKKSKT